MNLSSVSHANDIHSHRTILLVEDEPFVREATCHILQSIGLRVLCASDAQQATQLFEENGRRIDLLISDLVLPGRSGSQLGQDIHRDSPGIPVLLISGYLNAAFDTDSVQAHTYYLAKPYSSAELVAKIDKIFGLAIRRAARQAG
jgi:DNA-binding NtrC family response regulator